MSDPADANLQLKKRARRRLVGAVAFAGLAAVVLPMIMDDEPKQQVQDVQIRIPGQEQAPFNAKLAKPAPEKSAPAEKPIVAEKTAPAAPATPAATPAETPPVANAPKPVDKKAEPEKAPHPAAEKAKPQVAANEPQRAAAILSGKGADAAGGQYVILIGAFSNPANVKQLQSKIGELGIHVFTESLDSPEGKKTRVRAGPFASAEAADKALDKMKRIGVNGVVAAKQ